MSKKSIDATFVHYGIRKDDLQLIETLCAQHELNSDWVKGLLESYQTAATQDKALDDGGFKKLLDKELQKIKM